jgi:beta-glucosidase
VAGSADHSGGSSGIGSGSGGTGGASVQGGVAGASAGAGASVGGSAGSNTGAAGTAGSAGAGGGSVTIPAGPYPSAACADMASTLLGQMTQDEKLAQLMQLERTQVTPAQVTQYGVGSVFSQGGSAPSPNAPSAWADMGDSYHSAARASRLHIPVIYGLDAVHGLNNVEGAVVFPHNGAWGATRDPALLEQGARITAQEMSGCGVDFTFSPMLGVARDERWGRTQESFGETPDVVSPMGAALIKGLEFRADGHPSGIVGSAKHYVGDGGTLGGKDGGDTSGDETALRAIHLTAYRAAVAARLGAVMVSYSSWQGVKNHVNQPMITDVLKGELGFGGFVVSDFDGCDQIGAPSHAAGLARCLNAGVDLFMLFPQVAAGHSAVVDTLDTLRGLVPGTVPQSRIDDAVRRIIGVKCEMGLFSGNGGSVDRNLTAQVGSAEHRLVARQAVRESLVVLKNDGAVLPLSKTATIALAGNSADNTGNQCGGWTLTWQGTSGNVVPGATSIRQAFESELGAAHVVYSLDGTSSAGASVGVAVIGETPYAEGKGDRSDLTVTSAQVATLRALKQAGLKTVLVVVAGRPQILDPLLQYADAIVMAWLPGSEGAGVTDVLFGDAPPVGKLPHSWPRSMAQIPINIGDANYDPLFPFGYGLSY